MAAAIMVDLAEHWCSVKRTRRKVVRITTALVAWRAAGATVLQGGTMKKFLSLIGLALCSCGSDPGYTIIDRPSAIASEPQATKPESPEAPRKTVIALQTCADHF